MKYPLLSERAMRKIVAFILIVSLLCIGATTYADASISDSVPVSTLSVVPLYEGSDYVVLQNNQPDFYVWQISATPYVLFSRLDAFGRTGAAMACLGPETLPTQARSSMGNVYPSGWQTTQYDELGEDRYLYNRSHVIGFMLCGDNATPENLFTGTRYLNAGGMVIFESQVADYISRTKNHVIYRCTPIYAGDDLVASGIQMEAYSVEDRGALCFNVFAFNIQPGIVIDYSTGKSAREGAEVSETVADRSSPQATEAPSVTYILNTNTKRFHYPNCPSVRDIKDNHKKNFYGTRDEAIAAGYAACGRCHP